MENRIFLPLLKQESDDHVLIFIQNSLYVSRQFRETNLQKLFRNHGDYDITTMSSLTDDHWYAEISQS